MTTNPFEWHDNALKGVFGPVHDGEPQTGYYVSRKLVSQRGETPRRYEKQAVAYWKDSKSGAQRCHVNGKEADPTRALEIWQFCNRNPIPEDVYFAFLETGKWPEHNEVLAEMEKRSNEAPDEDSLQGIEARIDALIGEANRLMAKGAAKTQAEADQAADVAVKLGELYNFAEKRRKEEKQPSIDEGKRIDGLWNPVRDKALIYQRLKQEVVNPFLRAEEQRIAAEQAEIRRKQLEADQKARDAAAAAVEMGKPAPAPAAPPPAPPPALPKPRAGSGKAVTGRVERTMQIDDWDKAIMHFKENLKLREVVQALANAQAKLQQPVPGCTIIEGSKAQ